MSLTIEEEVEATSISLLCQKDKDSSVEEMKKAIAVSGKVDSPELFKAWQIRALAFLTLSRAKEDVSESSQLMDQAIDAYEKAVAVLERLGGDEVKLAAELTNISAFYYNADRFAEMAAANEKAMALIKGKPDVSTGILMAVYNKLAGAYLKLGKVAEAEAILHEGFSLINAESAEAAHFWSSLARVYDAKGDSEAALNARRRAEKQATPGSCALRK